jgi:hypothetical protein
MHLIGRWERVREFGPATGLGRGYVLDRKWGELLPVKGEWWRARNGMWFPVALLEERGALTLRGPVEIGGLAFGWPTQHAPSATTLALNAAYTYGSTGPAYGGRVVLPATKTLNEVYWNAEQYFGTAANVNDIDVEVRNDSSKPGNTLHASVTKNPSSATGWIRTTGFTQSMTGGTIYWIVVADPDGNGTDRVQCRASWNAPSGIPGEHWATGSWFAGASTTNGWSTASISSRPPLLVLVFSDGSVVGVPYTAANATTSDTNQKGMLISGGFAAGFKLWGVTADANIAVWNAVNVWSGSSGPTGTPFAQATKGLPQLTSITSTNIAGFVFDNPVSLAAETTYRVVFAFSGNATRPSKLSIGTGADANLRKAMLGGGNIQYTTQNAGPGWTDDQDAVPQMALLIEDFVAGGFGATGGFSGARLRVGH